MTAPLMGAGAVKAEPELTPWFDDVLPAREGAYIVDDEDCMGGVWFAYWNGARFGYREQSAQLACDNSECKTDCLPLVKWRGLAADPSRAAK